MLYTSYKDINMKKQLYKIGLSCLIVLLASCNDFGTINTSQTQSTNLNPTFQLVDVQMKYSGDYLLQLRSCLGITMPLLQQLTGTFTNLTGANYTFSAGVHQVPWMNSYSGIVVNIVDAEQRTKNDASLSNLNAMTRIMKVMVFARLTDLYGDLPYFEAGKGYISGFIQPKFDAQQDIYNDFFKELKEAEAQLDATKDKVSADQFYGGDVAKWKKLASSLRLRYAMRLVKVDPAKAQAEAEAAVAGVFASNVDICMTKHEDIQSLSGSEYRGNGLSASLVAQADPYRFTTTFLELLKPANNNGLVDPRLNMITRCYFPLAPLTTGVILTTRIDITDSVASYYAKLPGNNAYSGVLGIAPGMSDLSNPNLPKLDTLKNFNVPGKGKVTLLPKDQRRQTANFLLAYSNPFLHITYSEIELLLAEAKFRGWNVGTTTANVHYQNGIKAAIEQLKSYKSAPAAVGVDAFVAAQNLTAGKELEQINTQLYFALFLNPIEGYSNWRRSGFPTLTPVNVAGVASTTIPRRLQYPLSEVEGNNANLLAAVANIDGVKGKGIDSYLNHVWWDK